MITLDQLLKGRKGALFDMDGTLIDSDYESAVVKQELLKAKYRLELPIEKILTYCGVPDLDFYVWAVQEFAVSADPLALIEEHNAEYDARIAQIQQPLPGVQQFLEALHDRKIRMGIISGSYSHQINLIRKNLGWDKLLPIVVSCEDTVHHKPHPEPFEKGTYRLGLAAHEVFGVENAEPGIISIKAAGLFCLGVTAGNGQEQDLYKAGADVVVENLGMLVR